MRWERNYQLIFCFLIFFPSENSIETVETLKNKMLKLENKENHNEKHCVVCLVSEILNIISNFKKTSCKKQKIF